MFSRVIVSSLLLAALANGLAFRRDDGYSSSSTPVITLPTVSPEFSLPDPSISLSLPSLSMTLSMPSPSVSPSVSIVTTTVYLYPTQCPPNPSDSLPPTAGPSGDLQGDLSLPQSSGSGIPPIPTIPTIPTPPVVPSPPTTSPPTIPTPPTPSFTLPQPSPLILPAVRRDDNSDIVNSVVAQMRDLEQYVMSTFVGEGKGDELLDVLTQIENLIAQVVAPGSDPNALLQQAQDLVNNS